MTKRKHWLFWKKKKVDNTPTRATTMAAGRNSKSMWNEMWNSIWHMKYAILKSQLWCDCLWKRLGHADFLRILYFILHMHFMCHIVYVFTCEIHMIRKWNMNTPGLVYLYDTSLGNPHAFHLSYCICIFIRYMKYEIHIIQYAITSYCVCTYDTIYLYIFHVSWILYFIIHMHFSCQIAYVFHTSCISHVSYSMFISHFINFVYPIS